MRDSTHRPGAPPGSLCDPPELLHSCPDSPYALRALVQALGRAEETLDETDGARENRWAWKWFSGEELEDEPVRVGDGPEFRDVSVMAVAHGNDNDLLLAHKRAIDGHLAEAGLPVSYTNVFWGGRSEIKPSEISPIAYRAWCARVGLDLGA